VRHVFFLITALAALICFIRYRRIAAAAQVHELDAQSVVVVQNTGGWLPPQSPIVAFDPKSEDGPSTSGMPSSFTHANDCSAEPESESSLLTVEMRVPKFLQRMFARIAFVEVGDRGDCVGTPLHDHLRARSDTSHSASIPFHWDFRIQDALDSLFDRVHSHLDAEGFTVTDVAARHRQQSFFIITCPTSVGGGNAVSFRLCLKVAVDILHILAVTDVSLGSRASIRGSSIS
jgi:hypothetical protein